MDDKAERRIRMGLETLKGDRPQGFFTPYRYADQVVAPTGYPELNRFFEAAEPAMTAVLNRIDRLGEKLAALDGPPPRPRWGQTWFPRLDGAAAIAMVVEAQPKRIIEVGSGHSTRFMAEGVSWAGTHCELTCIDPQPRADLHGIGALRQRVLSEADLPDFAELEPGDIAFFDSSHILWPGTDVDMILNRIIPALKPGVLIHIHDILLPDPYPAEWEWRGYTEQNGVAPLMLGACEIVFSSHYAVTRMAAADRPGVAGLPLADGALETSLWLRRAA
ncbi:MAG: class I SAM-dependent methyltransferase [Pseudomonadota bacterium]